MSIELSGYTFDGPYLTTSPVRKEPGVYVVMGDNGEGDFKLLDVGESDNVRESLDKNDNTPCWKSFGFSRLAVTVYYTPEAGRPEREEIVKKLIEAFSPPCAKE